MPGTLYLSFSDRAALEREYEANLAHGRAFVGGASGFELFAHCTLVLRHPERPDELHVVCEVVMVQSAGPLAGVALQFRDRSERARAELGAFCALGPCEPGSVQDEDLAGATDADGGDDDASFAEEDAYNEAASESGTGSPRGQFGNDRRERLRNLSAVERAKIAQGSMQEDRVLLERMYGSAVWEALLHNPRITAPEVATMARKGTLPRPLLELIANNEQWTRTPIIRRALLGNPRLSGDGAVKVLRCLSARELKLVPQQTAYPLSVRQAAQRLLRGG